MFKPADLLVLVALIGAAGGCAPTPGPPRAPPSHPPPAGACPFGIGGAEVTTADTERGIEVVVTAAPDDVPELRERASDAAKLHGPFGRLGKGHGGQHGGGGQHGLQGIGLPPSRASAEPTPGGARIEIVPTHSSDRAALRTAVRERARIMSTAPCDKPVARGLLVREAS